MPRNRIADLRLRGNTSPLPVRVYWPGQATRPVPLLVFCSVGAGAGSLAEVACRSLSQDAGLVVLSVCCAAGARDGTAVLEWAAEHAANLGADPGRLLVAGEGAGGAMAAAVFLLVINDVVAVWWSPTWAPLVYFAALVIVLSIRPQGLFGRSAVRAQ
jgi:acetyl esterase/lipase